MPFPIISVFIIIFVFAAIYGFMAAQKRRQAMMTLAMKLGLRFNPDKDRFLAKQYKFLDKLRRGHNRYAYNILSGNYRDYDVKIFDYHYQTGSGKDTHHYHFSFFMLQVPMVFPELTIFPEGVFSKIGQALGYDDIDFESHEFSRKFCVRSKDKKFAYDICNAKMIEYLLSNSDLSIEIENTVLAVSFKRRLAPELIEPNLNRLFEVRSLIPDYVFNRR